jgi:hypothetical protein
MTDHLDVLERLARMRAEGILSEEEFAAEKARVLSQRDAPTASGKSVSEAWEETAPQRKAMWRDLRWQMLALVVIFPVIAYVVWLKLSSMTPEEAAQVVANSIPQCASQDVRGAVRNAIENSPASNIVAIKVLELANIEDRGVGGTPTKRYCAADLTTNGGTEHIGFTIRYNAEATDQFVIEIGDDVTAPPSGTPSAAIAEPELISQLVGSWAYSDICGTDSGIRFNADGTYTDFGSDEGRYSFDGKAIKFFDRKSVAELGDEDPQFVPEPLGDMEVLVKGFNGRTMLMNGQIVTKC